MFLKSDSSSYNGLSQYTLRGVLLLAVLLLSACVTTERGGVGNKVDDEKAVEYSVQLGNSYIREGNWPAAKRHLRNALEISKTNPDIYVTLAQVFQNTGELDLAEKNFKEALKLKSDFSRGRNNYAVFLFQQERYKEAAEQLEEVVKDTLYERRAGAYENLGRCYMMLTQYKAAQEAFRRSHLMNRRNVGVVFQLAEAEFELGRFAEAQKYYDAYKNNVQRQPSRALWLGYRLAREFGNKDAMSSFSLALKNLYPTSKEYLLYKNSLVIESGAQGG